MGLNINVAESKKCNGEYSLFITFDFDMRIVNAIREFPSKYWNADKKEWELPLNKLGEFINKVDFTDITITGKYVSLEKKKAKIPDGKQAEKCLRRLSVWHY